MTRVFAPLALALLTTAALGQHPGYEQIIIPFGNGTIPGMLGTTWAAELWVYNQSDRDINLFPERCFQFGQDFPCERKIEVKARSIQLLDLGFGASSVLAYVPLDRVDDVHFNLRIRDLSVNATSAGTEIPVIRERNYRKGESHLLNVPVDPQFRSRLRIYSAFGGRFTIQIYRMIGSTELLALRREVSLTVPPDYPGTPIVAFAMDVTDVLNEADVRGADRLRISINAPSPFHPGYWPLLTLTNNETQQVTTITPQ